MGIWDWFKRTPATEDTPAAPSGTVAPVATATAEPREDWRATSDYMSPDEAKALIVPDAAGLVPVRLVPRRGELVFMVDGHDRIVSHTHPSLTKYGIFAGTVRGTNYHKAAARSGDFAPGSPVDLRREPDNEHDPNAVAVSAQGDSRIIGYINKGKAARLAKKMDAGTVFSAVAIAGERKGQSGGKIAVVAAEPEVLAHLLRRR